MADWNPEQYLQFRNERSQPSLDLIHRIDLPTPASIIDIGCGPGNSTQLLRQRWPSAELFGLDSSEEMIRRARADAPGIQWLLSDVAAFDPHRSYDLIFSNAALQWIQHHEALMPRLFAMLNPGGALAVQVPANWNSPFHRAFIAVARGPTWRARMRGCSRLLNYRNATYYDELLRTKAARFDLWETTYFHVLASPRALLDWYRSTAMRPCLQQLSHESERTEFEEEVLARAQTRYPPAADGKVLYPFKRVFFIAYKR